MKRPRFTIRSLLASVVFLAVGLAALRGASAAWDSSVLGLTLVVLLASVLLAVHRTGAARAYWLGFALFGWTYLVLAEIPGIGVRLPTTRTLIYVDSLISNRSDSVTFYTPYSTFSGTIQGASHRDRLHGLARRCDSRQHERHAVEAPVDEEQGDGEEGDGQQGLPEGRDLQRQLDGEQAEQRGELDDRVHRHRTGVLERVAHGVADDGRGVQGVPFSRSSVSTIFLALSQAPPALAMKIAWNSPEIARPIR